jgi:uncharacterized protein YcfJ
METSSLNRIHPLMAGAAVSVILVSLTGAAAITGLLPTSKGAPDKQLSALAPAAAPYAQPAAPYGQPAAPYAQPAAAYPQPAAPYPQPAAPYAQPAAPGVAPVAAPLGAPTAAYMPVSAAVSAQQAPAQPAPVVREKKPEVKRTVEKTRVVHHYHKTEVARNDAPRSYQQQAAQPAPAQPNYVGIGTGAVIGGLIGNQIGGGNGKKLATVAGVIGGGIIGNEIANRNR